MSLVALLPMSLTHTSDSSAIHLLFSAEICALKKNLAYKISWYTEKLNKLTVPYSSDFELIKPIVINLRKCNGHMEKGK